VRIAGEVGPDRETTRDEDGMYRQGTGRVMCLTGERKKKPLRKMEENPVRASASERKGQS